MDMRDLLKDVLFPASMSTGEKVKIGVYGEALRVDIIMHMLTQRIQPKY